MHPNSKIAKENLEVFADMWQWLASDVNAISKEIIEMVQALSKPDRTEYLSLPRPGVRKTKRKGHPLMASQLLLSSIIGYIASQARRIYEIFKY